MPLNKRRRDTRPIAPESVVNKALELVQLADAIIRDQRGTATQNDKELLRDARRRNVDLEAVLRDRQESFHFQERAGQNGNGRSSKSKKSNGRKPSPLPKPIRVISFTEPTLPAEQEPEEIPLDTGSKIISLNGHEGKVIFNARFVPAEPTLSQKEPTEEELGALHEETMRRFRINDAAISQVIDSVREFGEPSVMRERA